MKSPQVIKQQNKIGKWTNYQNFTCEHAKYFPFLNFFSLNLQEPHIRNTTQRTWNLTNSVAIKHFVHTYEYFQTTLLFCVMKLEHWSYFLFQKLLELFGINLA